MWRIGALVVGWGAVSSNASSTAVGQTTTEDANVAVGPSESEVTVRSQPRSFDVQADRDEQVDLSEKAKAKREETIELLKTKVIPGASEDRKAELIFRLAELYWEKSKGSFAEEMEAFEAAYRKWSEQGKLGQPPTRGPYLRQSERIKENALQLYRRVLSSYPDYERNDEVLFYLALHEYEVGSTDSALAKYRTLIERFPTSDLVDDAYLQLGEHFFNDNQLAPALQAYERASRSSEPRISDYALYKLAWCDYNRQEYVDGIKRLKTVIERSEKSTHARSLELKSEALNDLARFFSYVDEVESAFSYFENKGGEELAVRYTERLGNLYGEQGKWRLQIETFRLLLGDYPLSERAPLLQSKVVTAFSSLNERLQVRQEVERLVERYRPGTEWFEHHVARGEAGREATTYARDLTETSLRNLVTEYHREAQKREDVETYSLARDIYARYLEAFGELPAAFEMRYYYAEVLWALEEWSSAAAQYDEVARQTEEVGSDRSRARIQLEAAYSQILAYEKIVKEGRFQGDVTRKKRVAEQRDKGVVNRQVTRLNLALDRSGRYDEVPIPEAEKALADACDLYFSIASPDDEELPAIKFKAAYVFYRHNHFVESAARYFDIIENYPKHPLAKRSASLILESLNAQNRWTELTSYAARFKDNDELVGRDRRFAQRIQHRLESATYLSIQSAEKEARTLSETAERERALARVAERFEQFQSDYPNSTYADEATLSAVLIYGNARTLDRAIRMAERFRKIYEPRVTEKDSRSAGRHQTKAAGIGAPEKSAPLELVQRNHLLLAEFYERIADHRRAAELYDSFHRTHPRHDKAGVALYNAAIQHERLGDFEASLDRFQTYLERYAKGDEAERVHEQVCALTERLERWPDVTVCSNRFLKRFPDAVPARRFLARYRAAASRHQAGRERDALRGFRELVDRFPNLPNADQNMASVRKATAHAQFELIEPEFEAYLGMKLDRPDRRLLDRKIRRAQGLACVSTPDAPCPSEGRYVQVLALEDGTFGICALTRIGQVFEELAVSLRAAPVPRQLSLDQAEIYRAEIDALASGPEEKAVSAYRSALTKAYELGLYDGCTRTAQERLKGFDPTRFPDLHEPGFRRADFSVVADVKPADAASAAGPPKASSDSVSFRPDSVSARRSGRGAQQENGRVAE